MNVGRYIFAQITDFIPRYEFDKMVAKYIGDFHEPMRTVTIASMRNLADT